MTTLSQAPSTRHQAPTMDIKARVKQALSELFDFTPMRDHARRRAAFRRQWLEDRHAVQARASDLVEVPACCIPCGAGCKRGEQEKCALVHAERKRRLEQMEPDGLVAMSQRALDLAYPELHFGLALAINTHQFRADCMQARNSITSAAGGQSGESFAAGSLPHKDDPAPMAAAGSAKDGASKPPAPPSACNEPSTAGVCTVVAPAVTNFAAHPSSAALTESMMDAVELGGRSAGQPVAASGRPNCSPVTGAGASR